MSSPPLFQPHGRAVAPWRRLAPIVLLAGSCFLAVGPASAANQWSGTITATLDLDDAAYSRHETQTWTLTGAPPTQAGSIAIYQAKWHYTGAGSASINQIGGSAAVTWTIETTQDLQIAIGVRASDQKLTIHQWSVPVYVANALTLTGEVPGANGGPPTTGASTLGVSQWTFNWLVDDPTKTDVTGSSASALNVSPLPTPLQYSGSVQPTLNCSWHFTFGPAGGGQTSTTQVTNQRPAASQAAKIPPKNAPTSVPKSTSPAQPPAPPPTDPANFKAAQTGEGQVQLSWDAVAGVTTYLVLGPGGANGGKASDGLKVQNTTVTLTSVPAGAQEWRLTSWYDPDGSRTTAANWPKADLTVVAPKNHYRVTATHVLINHEEPDDGSKLHGKDNEIFVTAYTDVFDRRNNSALMDGPLQRTPIHGDTNNSDPNKGIRIQAGTVSGTGGIQTGDDVQIWMWDFTSPSHWPFVVWEGDLTNGVELVVLRPMVWAVGGGEQRFWTPYSNRVLYNEHPADIIGLPEVTAALGQTSGISVDTAPELTTSANYTVHEERPIGMALTRPQAVVGSFGGLISSSTENMPAVWSDRIIVLTREKLEAFLAGRAAGTLQVRVTGHTGDGGSMGDYTLFLGIERM